MDEPTASRKIAAALERSASPFRSLAEHLPVICLSADADGWVDWYNGRWYEYTGQSPEESRGWGWQATHHPDDFLEVMRRWPHAIASGEPFEMEFRLRGADGLYRWFLARAEPARDRAGKIARWYGTLVDIDAQKQAVERSTRVAETLHEVFLPKHLPRRRFLRMDAVYVPAEKEGLVGGDWFDAFDLPDGRIGVTVGDVAGHGVAASVLAAKLRQSLAALAYVVDDPADMLRHANRILKQEDPDVMVTALAGVIDADLSTLRYASAGHPPPIVAYRRDEPGQSLPCSGPPLGAVAELELPIETVPLARDAVVAIFTDGLLEVTRDVISVETKLRSLVALLVGNTTIARPAIAVQEIVFDEVPTRDDAALLVIQLSEVDARSLREEDAEIRRTWLFHSSDARAAHATRREIAAFLERIAEDPNVVFEAELVLGELIANTVEHAPGIVEIHVDWSGERPIVEVRDCGPGVGDFHGSLPDAMAEGGRGIFLVKAMSDEAAAVRASARGTKIRVVLPVRRKERVQAPDAGG